MRNLFRRNPPELLAPAGNMEALQAAVKAGADAVYVGGSLFSARAYAGNFDTEELQRAMDYCHIYGARLYMALNTILKEDEIGRVPDYLRPAYEWGLDGIIVQDLGVASLVAREFPGLPLHASTQMSVSSCYGAKLLKNMGFTRVVPARELSLDEIISIKKETGMEIETFIHGAMCYCYSGRCLFSSFLGGRSGNRGKCAQPCRQTYYLSSDMHLSGDKSDSRDSFAVFQNEGINTNAGYQRSMTSNVDNEGSYIMSMKDMCTLDILPDLIDAGIDSFKIEGRMKKPEYVASAVAAYRQAIDTYLMKGESSSFAYRTSDISGYARNHSAVEKSSPEEKGLLPIEKTDLQDIYNRGGFSTGYYMQQRGKDMISSARPNHTGLLVGRVEKIRPPHIFVRLIRTVNPQDVLEFRECTGLNPENKSHNSHKPAIKGNKKEAFASQSPAVLLELQSGSGAKAGELLQLKGHDFKSVRNGMEVYRTRNNKLIEDIRCRILEPEKVLRAKALVRAREGEPLEVTITEHGWAGAEQKADGRNIAAMPSGESVNPEPVSYTVTAGIIEKAGNRPTAQEKVLEKMKKTGGSGIRLDVICNMDDDIFIPMSVLNELRREAVEGFKIELVRSFRRKEGI